MLGLRFFNDPGEAVEVDAAAFVFHGDSVFQEPEGNEIARHFQEEWLVGSDSFKYAQCQPEVMCAFRQGSSSWAEHGPFPEVNIRDGVLSGGGKPLAMLEKNGNWCSLVGSDRWTHLRLGVVDA